MEEPPLPPVADSGEEEEEGGPQKKWQPFLGIGGCPSWEMGGEIGGKGKRRGGRPKGVFGEEREEWEEKK